MWMRAAALKRKAESLASLIFLGISVKRDILKQTALTILFVKLRDAVKNKKDALKKAQKQVAMLLLALNFMLDKVAKRFKTAEKVAVFAALKAAI